MSYTNQEKQAVEHPPIVGSEQNPAEVQANTRKEASPPSHNQLFRGGYRVSEEGQLNNYAVEPKMYDASYPSQKQQRRYIFIGLAALLFVALAVWTAFVVS